MPWPNKAKRKTLAKELNDQRVKELKSLGKYAAKEYANVAVGIVDELGSLFTGARPQSSKKR